MGAAGQSFERIAERRSACTGRLWANANVWRHTIEPGKLLRRYRFGFKTLDIRRRTRWGSWET